MSSEIRNAYWFTEEQCSQTSLCLVNLLDDPIACLEFTSEERLALWEINQELSVARSRYETGPVPASSLRAALGKNGDSYPVRLSTDEIALLIRCKTLPISVRDIIVSQ